MRGELASVCTGPSSSPFPSGEFQGHRDALASRWVGRSVGRSALRWDGRLWRDRGTRRLRLGYAVVDGGERLPEAPRHAPAPVGPRP